MPKFTGEESAADILRIVLEEFSSASEDWQGAEIIYQDGTPFLKYQSKVRKNLGSFVCYYRLDEMTANVFPECERIHDEAAANGLFGEPDELGRKLLIRHLAFYAMNAMLRYLMVLQLVMFEENFNSTMFLTAATMFDALAYARQTVVGEEIAKEANSEVKKLLDKTVDNSAKKQRERLVKVLNSLPRLNIPTGVGRPKGSTKPEDVKAQEAEDFDKQIEEAIRSLISSRGEMPTKTAVAKALGIGGLNPATGIDSSLQSFNGKLKRLGVDYDAIVERVRLNK